MRRCAIAITLGAALLWPGAAQAATPRCGDTVTSDVTLTRALRCAGEGLTVARGVTLDLGGHTLFGDGTGTGIAAMAGATVRNGRVLGFETGVWAGDGDRTIEDMTVAHNGSGIVALGAVERRKLTVRRSLVTANAGDGLVVMFMAADVSDSRFLRNGGAGVRAARAEPGSFRDSAFTGNAGTGLLVSSGTTRISGNSASRNGGDGIVVDDSLSFFWPYSLAGNLANGNAGVGIWFRGLAIDPASGTAVDGGGNRAKLNGDLRQCVQIACTRR